MKRNATQSYQNIQTAIVATGNSGVFRLPWRDFNSLTAGLIVSAATGTAPTLDLYIQTEAPDGNLYDVYHFPQQTAATTAGSQVFASFTAEDQARAIGTVGNKTIAANALGVGMLGNSLQLAWTVGGTTPSFTFTLNVYSPSEDHGSL